MSFEPERPGRLPRYVVENKNGWILDGTYSTKSRAVKAMEKDFAGRTWRQIKRAYGLRIRKAIIQTIDD